MLSYFIVFLQITDQISECGSSIRGEQTPRRSSPGGDAAHMPVSQRNPRACGWDEGEEEQTWRIKGFQAWSSSCIPPCLSVFLCWSLTLSVSLFSLFPPSISISCSSSPNGVVRQDRWCFPDVLASNAALLSVCSVPFPHYSFLFSTQVLIVII